MIEDMLTGFIITSVSFKAVYSLYLYSCDPDVCGPLQYDFLLSSV